MRLASIVTAALLGAACTVEPQDSDTVETCDGSQLVCQGEQRVWVNCEGDTLYPEDRCMGTTTCIDEDDDGEPIEAVCFEQCGVEQDHTICDPDEPGEIYWVDGCGEVTGIAETCDQWSTCDDTGGTPACTCEPEEILSCETLSGGGAGLYDETAIVNAGACDADDVVEECGFGTKCYQETGFFDDEPVCARSLTSAAALSPYYDNGCSFADWVRVPTNLDIDCRCRTTGDGGSGGGYVDPISQANPGNAIINCRPLGELVGQQWPLEWGSGPSFKPYHTASGTGGDFFGGAFDPVSRELYNVVRWGNSAYVRTGAVVAFQVDTGARRVVSGLYPSNAGIVEYGSGYDTPRPLGNAGDPQPLTGASSIKLGADGMLYVVGGGLGETSNKQRFIVRVHPQTGERTLVWMAQHAGSAGQNSTGDLTDTYGQCTRPGNETIPGVPDSVAFTPNAFTLDDDGNFYMTYHGVREGDGLVRISADGSTCEVLSQFGGDEGDVGGGFTPQNGALEGLMLHDGKAWTVSLWGDLITIDPATGDRTVVGASPSSGYTGVGYQNLFWDDTRDVVWAVGNHSAYTGSVIDPTNGQRESIFGDSDDYATPILQSDYGYTRSVTSSMLGNGNGVFHGAVVLDPLDNDIVWFTIQGGGLGKLELSTFNTYVHSM